MSIELSPSKVEELAPLRAAFYQSLTAPLAGNWDEVIHDSDLWVIRHTGTPIGYFSIGDASTLYNFFLLKPFRNQHAQLLRHIVEEQSIHAAVTTTHNPVFLTSSLEVFDRHEVHSYLYTDYVDREIKKPEFLQDFTIEVLPAEKLTELVAFYLQNTGGPEFWLQNHLGQLLTDQSIIGMFDGAELLGTLEIRRNRLTPYVDMGLVISSAKRKMGLGTYLAAEAKNICLSSGMKPICSCTANNLGSKRLIEKAGFIRTGSIIELALTS